MISQSGERLESERRSCCKCFITLLFLFILLLILRKQKEEDEIKNRSKVNLRQNENYNKDFSFGYIREISFLKYDSAIYISPNRKILPSITYINDYTLHVEGYDNILHNFENLSIKINEKNNNLYIFALSDNKNKNSICINKSYSDDFCAKINTVLVDKSLFKNMKIQSCDEQNSFCFFVFVQLKKNKCYNFVNLSYSCHENNMKNPNIFLINNYCYVLLASSKIPSVYEFIQFNLLKNENFNENTKTKDVEIITHFCGNLLNQIATIDSVNFRLLFVQQYIHINDKNLNNEVLGNETKFNKEINESEENEEKNTFNKYRNKEYNNNTLKFKINYYLTIIDMTSENKDIIEYVDYIKDKQEFSIFPPIHLAYDEQTNFYYIVQYENNGFLNFIFISPSKLSIYYTLKIREFYAGWLLNPNSEYDNKGLMLFGEYAPYEDELHIWNIINFQHNRYFVSIIKTYSNI
ncbi:conserved Plasmodium protein, unknown function [Plasmodium gallinaceum]|uniref:Uncharacterized protein n=1 Tax=Plasmodium gallinaceum TaxID=5849 RepID=A0A1J1GUI2_PLAGA|nr:conserved Plasmodium protein, unknown function [Plasmodium gallinaceum]CRG95899.1 conserved Plasmodium protein, unknown function [Plasmodium gallinaceum]